MTLNNDLAPPIARRVAEAFYTEEFRCLLFFCKQWRGRCPIAMALPTGGSDVSVQDIKHVSFRVRFGMKRVANEPGIADDTSIDTHFAMTDNALLM